MHRSDRTNPYMHAVMLHHKRVQQASRASFAVLQDPIGGSPAVLVKKWDITNEKQTELQLEASQEALQR